MALAVKPSRQVILIAQGDLKDLHFDIKDNRVILYDTARGISDIARALVEGARGFESAVGQRMPAIRRSLSPAAVYFLNLYGRLSQLQPGLSLHTCALARDPT